MTYKIPEGWRKFKLEEVIENISERPSKELEKIVTINTSDILNGAILKHNLTDNKKLPGQFIKTFNNKDILFSEIRPINKRNAFINFNSHGYVASSKLMVLRANSKYIKPEYFYYYITSKITLEYLQMIAESRSGTFPQIRFAEIKSLNLSLPSLKEQSLIMEYIGMLDDKIELNNKINKNLEKQAQAIFKHWFVDFEFPNENKEPYKSSNGELVESELGMIPKGWEVKKLVDEIKIIYGAPFKSKQFNEEREGYPLIRIRDLKTFNPKHFTAEKHPNREFIETGDVVAGMDGEFMPYIWLGNKAVLNQRVCKFESLSDSKYDNLYIHLLVKPHLLHIESYKTGTTVIHLGKRDLDSINILVPSDNIKNKYSDLSYKLWLEIITLAKEQNVLIKLRDTLLPKLMSGEIRIPLELEV